jgi:Endonuclease-reverse transcriptase
MYEERYDFIFITESWLHADITLGLLDPHSTFNIIRRDRPQDRHGGVCAIINKKWSITEVALGIKYRDLEMVCFDVIRVQPALRIFVVYRPPYSDDAAVSYLKKLVECTEQFAANDRVNIIVGDFNMSKINWTALTCPNDKINKPFLDFVVEHGFSQFVNCATRVCNNILDIVLADDDQIISQVGTDSPLGNSDHATVRFTVTINIVNSIHSVDGGYYKWHDADYVALQSYLGNIDWQSLICLNPSAMCTWAAFMSVLHTAIDLFVPFHPSSNIAARPKGHKRRTTEMRQLR